VKLICVKSRTDNSSLIRKNRYISIGNTRITLPSYVDPRLYFIFFNCKMCFISTKSIPPGYNIANEKNLIYKSAKLENLRSLNKRHSARGLI